MSSETHPLVIGIGNPLLDIVLPTDAAFLAKYGLNQGGYCFYDEAKHPQIYETMSSQKNADFIPGGATLNTIRICQGLLKERQATFFTGCISRDDYGDRLTALCDKEGVHTDFVYSDEHVTGVCGVSVLDKERSLCTRLGAANSFQFQHLQRPETLKAISKARYGYVAGFFLTVCPEAVFYLAKAFAESSSKFFCTGLSATYIIEYCKEQFDALMPYVDVLFGNEEEFLHWAKIHGMKQTNLPDIIQHIVSLPKYTTQPRIVVVTRGSEPTLVAAPWTSTLQKVVQYPVEPLEYNKMVDFNGAGDAFVGGFLYGLIVAQKKMGHQMLHSLKTLDMAVYFAHVAARHVIQSSGCRVNFTSEEAAVPEMI